MQAQFEFSRGEHFQGFLNALLNLDGLNQDNIVGVSIDFHPIWWRLATLWHESGGIDYPFSLTPFLIWPGWPLMPRPDPTWSNSIWMSICKDNGKEPNPFIVKICFRPGTDNKSRSHLRGFAREWKFFCVVEERPLAVAASSFDGGREIVANEPGTLGGFFSDKNSSRVFGVTCAHVGQVAGASVSLEDPAGVTHQNIGTVAHTSFKSLTPLGSGQACNRAVQGIVTQVDVALIELNKTQTALKTVPSVGTIDAIFDRTQFGAGDSVEMRGAISKHNSYVVGPYDAVYKVLFKNGNVHCFEHMFEIHRQSVTSSWVPPVLAAKPVHGDSGACICRPSPTGNFAYCGTLVAVDGTNGYACFSESVLTWAASLKPSINLVPL
jgi:hypothetical protein